MWSEYTRAFIDAANICDAEAAAWRTKRQAAAIAGDDRQHAIYLAHETTAAELGLRFRERAGCAPTPVQR
jgi:hypothetical protein